MSSIPEDVYLDVFERLPVNSLLACKCVCKSWFQLISNPSFVNKHLNHVKQGNITSLMFKSPQFGRKYEIWSSSYDSLLLSDRFGDHIVEMDYPFKSLNYSFDLVGCCNGLVCLRLNKIVCLWNPATKEYKELPADTANKQECSYGFGYDRKADDYKVISIMYNFGPKRGSFVNVYTLSTNSWKSWQHVPYYDRGLHSGVLFNGALHWLVGIKYYPLNMSVFGNFMISFDISGENFNEVPLTNELSERCGLDMTLGVLEEFLCVVDNNEYEDCFDVWVMQEYGVRESWAKRYNISHERIINDYLHLDAFKKGGELLFKGTFGQLELTHENVTNLNLYGTRFLGKVDYLESLVSLNSGVYVGGRQDERKRESRRRRLR